MNVSYIVDKRLDANASGIKTLLVNYIDTLLTFKLFQNSPNVTSSSIFVSILTSNGLAILDEDTAIGPAGIVIGQAHGQWQFNYLSVAAETGYNNPSAVLLVGSSLAADDGKSFPVFGGVTSHLTLGRILFHELTHLIFDWSKDTILGIQFEEELAVFAENVIYTREARARGWIDSGAIRYGHNGALSPSGSISGVNAFSIYQDVEVDYNHTDRSQAVFTAMDGMRTLTKTYFNSGVIVGTHAYDHYIHLEETSTAAPYVTATATAVGVNIRSTLYNDMMGGSLGVIGANGAVAAWQAINTLMPSVAPIMITRVHGLGADSWAAGDRAFSGVLGAGTGVRAPVIEINDSFAQPSTLLIGASGGASSDDILYAGTGDDIVVATGGNNEIYAGPGRDILIGTAGTDKMYGGSGADIFVASAGNDILDGGGDPGNGIEVDIAYYGNLNARISYGAGGVLKSNGIDTLSGIESIIGTGFNDEFRGQGLSQTIRGGGGDDRYYVGNGPDTFIDNSAFNVAENSISFENVSDGIELFTGVRPGNQSYGVANNVYFEGIANIRGTGQRDVLHLESGSGSRNNVWGGGGDDVIYVGTAFRGVYGEGDNDRFVITANTTSLVINGGDGTDTLDLSMLPTISVNLKTSNFSGTWGNTSNNFVSIEKFVFGAGRMQIDGTDQADGTSPDDTNLKTGPGQSNVNGWGGNDFITVTATVAGVTPAGQNTYGYVNVMGGAGDDTITAYRAATINGGTENDTIQGSPFQDLIYGGYGNDTIRAGGGDDIFNTNDILGTDHVDGEDGTGDIVVSSNRITEFTFTLAGLDQDEIGVQLIATTNPDNIAYYRNVEKFSFYASYTANDNLLGADILSVLRADGDHAMTGAELRVAIGALSRPSAMSSIADPLHLDVMSDSVDFSYLDQLADAPLGEQDGFRPEEHPFVDWSTPPEWQAIAYETSTDGMWALPTMPTPIHSDFLLM